ncbi:MAG: glycosyltransferase family 4 protein [Ruminococcus sp.]|nr:glycosyltransferase family 4 protein [Ruminococcus sp.]
MKNVIIVHHTGAWGGGTKSLIDLCEMLCDEYHVIVCIPKGFPNFKDKISQYGCDVCEINSVIPHTNVYSGRPPLVSPATLKSVKSLRYIWAFGKEILALKPDIVIFNTVITAVSAVYLSRFTKVICIDRETMKGGFAKFFYRKLLDKHLDAITFLSEYERKKLGFRKCISEVFPDCVRREAVLPISMKSVREHEQIPADKFVILYMGGLAKIKGTDVILEAMDRLDDRFLLLFAGGMDENKLSDKQLIHDLKYPDIFFFKKRTKKYYSRLKGTSRILETGLRDSVDELIAASDIVVFPSTSVHQPRPCIEAGAYGKTAILSDYPETAEYFTDGYNALTFAPGNAKELAEKIVFAYEHRDTITQYGEHNRSMTFAKHGFDACKVIILSLIEKMRND